MIKYWWLSIMDDSLGNDNQVLSIFPVNNISVNISKFESSIVDRQSNPWFQPIIMINTNISVIWGFNGDRVLCYIAIEDGPFIVDLPMKDGAFP